MVRIDYQNIIFTYADLPALVAFAVPDLYYEFHAAAAQCRFRISVPAAVVQRCAPTRRVLRTPKPPLHSSPYSTDVIFEPWHWLSCFSTPKS